VKLGYFLTSLSTDVDGGFGRLLRRAVPAGYEIIYEPARCMASATGEPLQLIKQTLWHSTGLGAYLTRC